MVIKWYNRDRYSDQDIRRAKEVAKRLEGGRDLHDLPKPGDYLFELDSSLWKSTKMLRDGVPYIPVSLCLMCGKPKDECYC
jgi:hypothetical protein